LKGIGTASALTLTGSLTGCLGFGGGNKFVSIGGASQGGAYYPISAGIAQIITDEVDGMEGSAQETDGSIANVRLLGQGEIDMAFINPIFFEDARAGEEQFESSVDLQALFSAINYREGFITLSDDIETVGDLEGTSVATGASGSGMRAQANTILDMLDVSVNEETMGFSDGASALSDGLIDAQFTILLGSSTQELGATNTVKVVEFTDEQITTVTDSQAAYKASTLEPGTIADGSPPEPGTIIDLIGATLATTGEMSTEDANAITTAIYENVDKLQDQPRMGDFSLETAMGKYRLDIPHHEGAVNYYESQNAW
jgi:TRAP transporter TAXI family solute receptor